MLSLSTFDNLLSDLINYAIIVLAEHVLQIIPSGKDCVGMQYIAVYVKVDHDNTISLLRCHTRNIASVSERVLIVPSINPSFIFCAKAKRHRTAPLAIVVSVEQHVD